MNAANFRNSAAGLILAASFVAGSSLAASAADVTVALGAQASNPLTGAYIAPPTGMVTLGGHSFDMSTGNYILVSGGQKATYTGSWPNTKAVYLLLNTGYTYLQYQGVTVGTLTLTFGDGTTQAVNIVPGLNVREWRPAGSDTVNTTTDPSSTNAWTGSAQASVGGGTAVVDMLTVTVPTKTLTGFALWNNGTTPVAFVMSGLTIDDGPTATKLTRPGNSGNTPAAVNSQAGLHAKSANFTGQSPAQSDSAASASAGMTTPATADGEKHTNRGHR